mgnify:FL=1|jgi:putative Mn2+ efflux pump MntP
MISFLLNNTMLGVGLAMDAFSVSMANGLSEPTMKKSKMYGMAGVFAVFQGVMPFLGWLCVHTIVQYFTVFEKCIPWIALILLVYIGGKMIFEGRHEDSETQQVKTVGAMEIIIQGIATSIDALSVGFTIAEYNWGMMLLAVSVIAAVTFVICATGIRIGRKFGTKLSGKSQIFGGVILILIGIEIFIQGIF